MATLCLLQDIRHLMSGKGEGSRCHYHGSHGMALSSPSSLFSLKDNFNDVCFIKYSLINIEVYEMVRLLTTTISLIKDKSVQAYIFFFALSFSRPMCVPH